MWWLNCRSERLAINDKQSDGACLAWLLTWLENMCVITSWHRTTDSPSTVDELNTTQRAIRSHFLNNLIAKESLKIFLQECVIIVLVIVVYVCTIKYISMQRGITVTMAFCSAAPLSPALKHPASLCGKVVFKNDQDRCAVSWSEDKWMTVLYIFIQNRQLKRRMLVGAGIWGGWAS